MTFIVGGVSRATEPSGGMWANGFRRNGSQIGEYHISMYCSSTVCSFFFRLQRRMLKRRQARMQTNQMRQMVQVIRLNISISVHWEWAPQYISRSPQMVATQWQMMPAKKMVSVLSVRHTSPHGITRLMQQSSSPTTQISDIRNVPPHTIVDPQQMKFRNLRSSASVHITGSYISFVTYATISTPRLFICAGMLKGSISLWIGPWCFGICSLRYYKPSAFLISHGLMTPTCNCQFSGFSAICASWVILQSGRNAGGFVGEQEVQGETVHAVLRVHPGHQDQVQEVHVGSHCHCHPRAGHYSQSQAARQDHLQNIASVADEIA